MYSESAVIASGLENRQKRRGWVRVELQRGDALGVGVGYAVSR